jgi:hypothetical protein
VTTLLLAAGVLGPILFLAGSIVMGARRPSYRPRYTFMSQLSLDGGGHWQVANFVASGLLIYSGGIGLWALSASAGIPFWAWSAMLVAGLGFVLMGIFRDDPWLSYPPPDAPPGIGMPSSGSGWGHLLSAGLTGASLIGGGLVFASFFGSSGDPGWAGYSAASAVLLPALYLVALASGWASGIPGHRFAGYAGLFQRLAIGIALLWVAAVAARFLASTL